MLRDLGFQGTVYVPESEDWAKHDRYDDQIQWEWQALDISSTIVFWVPRDLTLNKEGEAKMPAFTNNVEFGLYARSGKCLLGCPRNAPKMNYLLAMARAVNMPIFHDLEAMRKAAIAR